MFQLWPTLEGALWPGVVVPDMTVRYLPDGRCDEADCCPICYDEEEDSR